MKVAALSVWIMSASAVAAGNVWAQSAVPPGVDRAAFAARRFPQAVRVGDLLNRTVLEPVESRAVLGHVEQVIKLANGEIDVVMSYGGHFGFGARSIAVPIDAVVLLGNELEVVDFTPQQLDSFPSFTSMAAALPLDAVIHMGLAHPSH